MPEGSDGGWQPVDDPESLMVGDPVNVQTAEGVVEGVYDGEDGVLGHEIDISDADTGNPDAVSTYVSDEDILESVSDGSDGSPVEHAGEVWTDMDYNDSITFQYHTEEIEGDVLSPPSSDQDGVNVATMEGEYRVWPDGTVEGPEDDAPVAPDEMEDYEGGHDPLGLGDQMDDGSDDPIDPTDLQDQGVGEMDEFTLEFPGGPSEVIVMDTSVDPNAPIEVNDENNDDWLVWPNGELEPI